jgi:hypothetical protein
VSARGEAGIDLTPSQALGAVLGPLAHRFSPALRMAIVESLGLHPPGQCVELDTGEIALVVAPRREDLARPVIRVIAAPGESERREIAPLAPERSIVRALSAAETPSLDEAVKFA